MLQTNDHSFIDLIEVSIGIKFDRPALQHILAPEQGLRSVLVACNGLIE